MMLHLKILRKLELFLIIRFVWVVAETQTADILQTAVPKLNISEPYIDMKVNSVLYLQCTGKYPLFWTYVDPMTEDDDKDLSHLSTGNTTADGYASTIRLDFKSAYQTGRYVCYHGNHNTSLYIFVDDGKHLLLPIEINAIIFHEGRSDVIRCLPTISKAEISLWKLKQPDKEMVPLSNTLEYDPTVGFKVKYPTDYFQRSFSCVAQYENRTDSIWLDIETLAATQQIPEIYIDAQGTEYVLLDTDFSMICIIKVEISTMIGEPRWAYPVSDVDTVKRKLCWKSKK
ncbi:uncharacterized protein LOC118198905 isoform X2 [Stegodyphus dumicola]|uniref:uncharacterized protein LOC118198905 isoform X2 n=1 Tax=Stegodyphus dumicola TaxID=202533 RepID=UPI0015A7E9E0|nr:uncharacterized protein LOC118198905 isoform X2 [Stegodyphus dumicola]